MDKTQEGSSHPDRNAQFEHFLDPTLGKAIPYGVYDVGGNQGWVSVGIDHDTARFAAQAIARWWKKLGGRPLVSHEVVVQLIDNTTTRTGLTIHAELDTASYPTGVIVTDEELAAVNIRPADFHGDWNYAILPKRRSK